MESRRDRFKELVKEKKLIDSTLAIIHWDLETEAPKKGVELISQMIGYLSLKSYEIFTSKEFLELLEFLNKNKENLPLIERKEIDEISEEVDKIKKIPALEYKEYSELTAKAQSIWEEAREKNDFNLFKGSLEKIFYLNKKFIGYRTGGEIHYDHILGDYEKGMTVQKLDEFFSALKKEIVPLLKKITDKKKNFEKNMAGKVEIEKQKEFSKYLAEYLGFDFERGVISQSAHPFTLTVDKDDVRLTTRYIEELPMSSIFSTIHEAGHGIYEQGIEDSLKETVLADGTSMGIHESQSRFYENIIGRSKEFWQGLMPELEKKYEYLKGVDLEDFHKGINSVQPSLIRVEADELTYSLHIMLRYEIEKGIFSEEYKIEELPKIWNLKMEEYLGITPKNDSEGVLQDVHWSCGLIGYFPSYALGNAYSAQIYNEMKKHLDIEKLLLEGDLEKIKSWLNEKIHKFGKLKSPKEIIKEVTGEDLNPQYYIDYLKEKYTKIYNL